MQSFIAPKCLSAIRHQEIYEWSESAAISTSNCPWQWRSTHLNSHCNKKHDKLSRPRGRLSVITSAPGPKEGPALRCLGALEMNIWVWIGIWLHQNAALCYLLLFLCNWGVYNLIYGNQRSHANHTEFSPIVIISLGALSDYYRLRPSDRW